MTKLEFKNKYKDSLELSSKSWDFIEKGNRKDGYVAISMSNEIEKDYIYYNYANNIWELNLNDMHGRTSLRSIVKDVATGAKADPELFKIEPITGKEHVMVQIKLNQVGKVISPNKKLPKILEKKAPQPNAMPLSNVIVFDSEPIAKYEPVNNNKYIADFLGISEKQYLKGVLLGELLDVVPGAQKQSIVDKLKIIMND